jgi:hypothetical protein
MPQSTDLFVVMTKRTFQYLVDNMTGLAFHRVSRHETSRLAAFLNVYLSVLRIPGCVRFSRIVSLPCTSFYLPYSLVSISWCIISLHSLYPQNPVVRLCTYVGINCFSWPIKAWSARRIYPFSHHIHGGVEVELHAFLNSQPDGKSWSPHLYLFTLG